LHSSGSEVSDEGVPLSTSIVIATLLHPVFVGSCLLIVTILSLLGITFQVMQRPELPKKNIEFVLVTKEAPPINKKTKFRADKNSRAGGVHDKRRPVSEPLAGAKANQNKKSTPPVNVPQEAKPKQIKQQNKLVPKLFQPKVEQAPTPKAPVPAQQPIPKAVAPKVAPKVPFRPVAPSSKMSRAIPTVNPKSTMQIPFPKTMDYKDLAAASGGPVSGTKSGTSGSTEKGKSVAMAPAPSFSPSLSGGKTGSSGSSSSSKGGAGGSGATGHYGNPGPGNPMGAPGIDAIREPDFGPYMKDLQRRIKMNWTPPKGNESKRVVLLFQISRDGRLLGVKVKNSSGLPAADQAAIQAVQLTAPFKPLPPNYRSSSVDIQFTFDYNVFGASRY